jgi:tetratricopeptide (TPR) repeat protein
MSEKSCRMPVREFRVRRRLCAGVICIVGSLGAMLANTANGQITTQLLIGDAVSEIGTRYSDVDQAIQRFNNRDVYAARQFLESAKRKDPTLPPTELTLAKMYILSGNEAAARGSMEKTALENPNDPEVYLLLAEQAISPQQNRIIEAEALYDKALGLIEKFTENPKRKRNFQIRVRAGRANVYERRKDWQAAFNDLQELLKIDPENAAGHYRLGRALFMQKKFPAGYAEFKTAREKDKNLPDPDVSAALMYDQLGDQAQAQKFFERAVAANKTDANVLTAYGQWLIKTGSLDKAEAALTEARKANPESLNLLILSGVAARMNKKPKPAEDHFMEALRIAPANGDVINQLALLLVEQPEQDKRERALQFAGISAQLNNQSADAQVTLAWVLFQLGRGPDAEQALRRGLSLGNPSPDSSYLVAKMLLEQKPDAAKQILTSALETETAGIFVNRKDAQALLDSLSSK